MGVGTAGSDAVVSESHNSISRLVIICVGKNLQDNVQEFLNKELETAGCNSAKELAPLAEKLQQESATIPLIIVKENLGDQRGSELLAGLHETFPPPARKILLGNDRPDEEIERALGKGFLTRHLAAPGDLKKLEIAVRELVADYILENHPEQVENFPTLIDKSLLSNAYQDQSKRLTALGNQLREVQRSFLGDMEMSDAEVNQAVIDGIDTALGNPPKESFPAESIILLEGQPVEGIRIVVSGLVQLSKQVEGREINFHSHTAGKIIGLLSLAHQCQAFFTCRAVTDVEVISISLSQLNEAMQKVPELSVHFVTALVRSLATRNRRVAELSAEVIRLNTDLGKERDNLSSTLKQLEKTQMRLVETEKLATLGQLSAGIAHELNNPVAAMQRAVDFIAEDIITLSASRDEGEKLKTMMLQAMAADPISTKRSREIQAELADSLGDRPLARRLAKMGITTCDEYRELIKGVSDTGQFLALLERYHQLGTSLRNMSSCGDRISGIVKSLRSYAKADHDMGADINIHKGLDDTLLMFNHALFEIEVEKDYGELPLIRCRAGEINQVWTNLISNAIGAIGEKGHLNIQTDCPDDQHIRVSITDSGPGIAPEHLNKIFDTNFTTKHGEAEFGLGLGLPICHQIVSRHGGSIAFESKAGETIATVVLPVSYVTIPGERKTI